MQYRCNREFSCYTFAGLLIAVIFIACNHDASDLLFDKKKTSGGGEGTGNTTLSVSTIPLNGATSVPVSTTITATFSAAMNTATITTNTTNTVCSGTLQVSSDNFATCVQMNAPMAISGGNTIFTMTPSTTLTGGPTNYKIRVTTAAQSTAGLSLAATFVTATGFTTQDGVAPTVSGTVPIGGSTGVATSTAITVTFSEAMNTATISTDTSTTCSGTLQLSSNNFASCIAMNGAPTASGGNTLFTIQPLAALATSTNYKIRVSTAAQDTGGNAIAATYTTSDFTTGTGVDSTPPTVSSTTPANAATGIAASSTISVSFNEAMAVASLSTTTSTTCSGSLQVSKVTDNFAAGTCVPMNSATPVASGGNTVFTITPAANLLGGTAYRFRIINTVTDVASNALASNYTADFTTIAAPIYLFASTTTTNGSMNGVGGRTGADQICNTSKPSSLSCPAGLHAVISLTGTDEIQDMATNYSIPAGRAVQGPTGSAFQTDWTTFVSGGSPAVNGAITAGIFAASVDWWSFGAPAKHASQDCTGGTNGTGGGSNKGRVGASAQSGVTFLDNGGPSDCATQAYLLCVCY